MRQDATEFEAEIDPNGNGGWKWRLVPTNGGYPHSIARVRWDEIRHDGETLTRWGARAEARRALKNIRKLVKTDTERVR